MVVTGAPRGAVARPGPGADVQRDQLRLRPRDHRWRIAPDECDRQPHDRRRIPLPVRREGRPAQYVQLSRIVRNDDQRQLSPDGRVHRPVHRRAGVRDHELPGWHVCHGRVLRGAGRRRYGLRANRPQFHGPEPVSGQCLHVRDGERSAGLSDRRRLSGQGRRAGRASTRAPPRFGRPITSPIIAAGDGARA